jgi:hypothetical protein
LTPAESPRDSLRPLSEPQRARPTAIVALAFLAASALDLAVEGVSLPALRHAFPFYALGGFGLLIFGTSRLLVAGMAGRDVAGGRASSVLVAWLAAVGAAGPFLAPRLAWPLACAWSLAALAHAVVTVETAARPPSRRPLDAPAAVGGASARIGHAALDAGSVAYAFASAIAVPLAFAGRVPLPSAIHLVLLGFVVVTVMGVAARILPRFTRTTLNGAVLLTLAPFALAGPALMTLGLAGRTDLLEAGGAIEAVAFALFAARVVPLLARGGRARLRDAPYALALLAVALGGSLGLAAAWRVRGASAWLAVHGALNAYGFVGLFVLGASAALYAPAFRAGARAARAQERSVLAAALGGLIAAAAGAAAGNDALARLGMLALSLALLAQLAGLAATHRRAARALRRREGS